MEKASSDAFLYFYGPRALWLIGDNESYSHLRRESWTADGDPGFPWGVARSCLSAITENC